MDPTIIAKRKYLAREQIADVASRLGTGSFADGVAQFRDLGPRDPSDSRLHHWLRLPQVPNT